MNPEVVISKSKRVGKDKTGCHRQYRWLCKSSCGEDHKVFLIVEHWWWVNMLKPGYGGFGKTVAQAGGTFWVPFGLGKPLFCLLLNQW